MTCTAGLKLIAEKIFQTTAELSEHIDEFLFSLGLTTVVLLKLPEVENNQFLSPLLSRTTSSLRCTQHGMFVACKTLKRAANTVGVRIIICYICIRYSEYTLRLAKTLQQCSNNLFISL